MALVTDSFGLQVRLSFTPGTIPRKQKTEMQHRTPSNYSILPRENTCNMSLISLTLFGKLYSATDVQ
jgi:hypothetical protein